MSLERLAALSPQARAVVMRRLRTESPQPSADAASSATPEQTRLWFLQRLQPGNPAYNLAGAVRIRGPLDTAVMTAVLTEIARRHEPLRTAFVAVDGAPQQLVTDSPEVVVRETDLRSLPATERDRAAIEVVTRAGRQPFELEQAPLARYLLIRTGTDEYVFGLVVHHLVADGRSFEVFAAEFAQLYQAFRAGHPSPLPDITLPYRCVRRQQVDPGPDETFWCELLSGDPPVLELPTDRPRPATQSFQGRQLAFELPADLSAELLAQDVRDGHTVFTRLLAAFATLLHRVSGQQDLVVGVPVAGRDSLAAEQLIGFLVNTLPIRLDLTGSQTHSDLIAHVRHVTRRAFAHQGVPFDRLVQLTQPPRDPARPVLRQVAFAFQDLPAPVRRLGDITVETVPPSEVDLGVSPLDLSGHMWHQDGRLAGMFVYNTDLFDAARVAGWARQFVELLRESVREPDSPLRPAPLEEQSNLTESQLRFYFARQYHPDVRLYYEQITSVFTLESEVDAMHLRQAIQAVVDRSDALRSVFHEVDGIPQRRVRDTISVELEEVDLSGASYPELALREWVDGRNRNDFDLGERLFDTALVRRGDGRSAWYLSVHHLVSDAWSTTLILRHVSANYELSLQGMLDEAPALPAYQDYVDHERQMRGSRSYRRSADHWRDTLAEQAGRPAFFAPSGSTIGTRISRLSVDLGERRTRRIQEVVRAEGFTSAAIIFSTALFAYLYRVSGERLLRIGTPFANRGSQFRETIGLFMNACPLQVEMAEASRFRSLARQVQLAFLQASRHLDYPVRNPPDDPKYDVYFNFQNASFQGFGQSVEVDIVGTGHSQDRLALQVRDFAATGAYHLDFDFNVECFGEADRARTATHYLNLLGALLDDPGARVDRVPMLTGQERQRVLVEWNQTDRPYRLDVPLHRRVERQVRQRPAAPAVLSDQRQLTYQELNAEADQLAARIRARGGGRGSIVGVCVERSAELVVSLLGVLKAGAAYLPLDPDHPAERQSQLLADSGAPVLVTQRRLGERLPRSGVEMVLVDAPTAAGGTAAADVDVEVAGDDLAYVIYTSGSTGKPKGVMIPHRAIANRLLWMQEEYQLAPGERVLQKTPFSFDVSVWEFFWPLITGATIVVAKPGGHKDPTYLADLIVRYRIGTTHFVPSMLRVFLDTPAARHCTSLRRVFASGEALPAEVLPRFLEVLPAAELHNLYGPTEAAVDVSSWACPPGERPAVVPIGRPVANTQLYVLDRHGNPVPPGISGELHIGGVQVADGYLNRPELTGQRFIPDPFQPGGSLYRTGDLARHLPDGNIEFLGRMDEQVKIRGFRVEPGEIEAELQRDPRVQAAVVTLHSEQLVAYVVAEADLPTEELRGALARSLPDYLLPAHVVVLPELPVTATGKLDRRALPAPGNASPVRAVPPRTPLEESLAKLWAEELGRDMVGVFDSFFDIGGHSLLAARLITKMNRLIGRDLPLAVLFRTPTIAGLAALADGRADPGGVLVPIRRTGRREPLYLFHPAGGEVLAYQSLATRLDPNRPVIGVQSEPTGAYRGLAEMAAGYAAEIRASQPDGPYFLAGWSMGGVLAVTVASLLEPVAFVGVIDSYVSVDGEPDPLLAPAVALADVIGDAVIDPRQLAGLRAQLRQRPLAERLTRVIEWARDQGLDLPADPLPALRRQADRAAQHEEILLGYRPPVAKVGLTVLTAAERTHHRDTDWAAYTTGPVYQHTIAGNHFTLLRPPNVDQLAAHLNTAIRAAATPTPTSGEGNRP